jgi:hypothetical protein
VCGSKNDLSRTCCSVYLVFTPGDLGSFVGTEDVRADRAVEASPNFLGDSAPCHRGLTVDSSEGLNREEASVSNCDEHVRNMDAAGRRETEGRGRKTD